MKSAVIPVIFQKSELFLNFFKKVLTNQKTSVIIIKQSEIRCP